MTYIPRESGNKGCPEPREGYQQRRIAFRRYRSACEDGWAKRIDDGVEYSGLDWVLCERKIVEDCLDSELILVGISDGNILESKEKIMEDCEKSN